MKKAFLFIAIVLLAALGWHFHQRNLAAADAADGQVAGTMREIGGTLGDASIIVRIKGKHFVDSDLSVLTINVDCTDGRVTLKGTAGSPALIERAVRLARETGGVTSVTSRLTVRE